MPLLRDFIAEHERSINYGGEAVRALDRGEQDRAGELLAAMGEELRSHWRGEENGFFAVMGSDDLFSEHIAVLVREHRELEALLESIDLADSGDRNRLREAVFDLREHIAKEEDGLFPASLPTLDSEQWDAAMAAWRQAHPGVRMIGTAEPYPRV